MLTLESLAVDLENAETDAKDLADPNWQLLHQNQGYRTQFVKVLLSEARKLRAQVDRPKVVHAAFGGNTWHAECDGALAEPF